MAEGEKTSICDYKNDSSVTKIAWLCPVSCCSPSNRILFLQWVLTKLGPGLDLAKEMGVDRTNVTSEPELSQLSREHTDALFLGHEPGTGLLWAFSKNEQSPTLQSLLSKGRRHGAATFPWVFPLGYT